MDKKLHGCLIHAIKTKFTFSHGVYASIVKNELDGAGLLVDVRNGYYGNQWNSFVRRRRQLILAILEMDHDELRIFAYMITKVDYDDHVYHWRVIHDFIKKFKLDKHLGVS